MARHLGSTSLAAVLLVLLVAGLPACGRDKTTNPVGGTTKEMNSGSIAGTGAQFQHTFASAGGFPYHCAIHPSMTASVTVAGGGPLAASVTIADFSFTPASVTVAPGGTVTWTNNGPSQHTVTSD